MRSWSPPGQRGLVKRNSVDGYTYRGRFRIRDVSFSEDYAPSEASVTSIRSAPVAGREVPLDLLDQRSDVSDYSCCLAVSEVGDKDDCGRLVEGFREDEAWNRQGCAERPASLRRENFGGGSAGDGTESGCGTESGRGKQSCLGMGEEKKTSARKESDLGRDLLVSSTKFLRDSLKKREALGVVVSHRSFRRSAYSIKCGFAGVRANVVLGTLSIPKAHQSERS